MNPQVKDTLQYRTFNAVVNTVAPLHGFVGWLYPLFGEKLEHYRYQNDFSMEFEMKSYDALDDVIPEIRNRVKNIRDSAYRLPEDFLAKNRKLSKMIINEYTLYIQDCVMHWEELQEASLNPDYESAEALSIDQVMEANWDECSLRWPGRFVDSPTWKDMKRGAYRASDEL